jgi:hypothetical protein
MKKLLLFMTLSALILNGAVAQSEAEKSPFKVEMHGFLGFSMFMDSRQSVNLRHNQINLFPKAEELDGNGDDINSQGMRSFDASHSRLGFFISAPEVLGAKSSITIEGDFLGGSGANDVNFRLRQAHVKLQWDNSYLLLGQSFHPLFVAENFPNTQVFSAGAPFHPLSRVAQVQAGFNLNKNWSVAGWIIGQNDFRSVGLPTAYEVSMIPEFTARIKYAGDNGFMALVNGGVATQRPSLTESFGGSAYKSDKYLVSPYFSAEVRQVVDNFTVKAGVVYGGNMTAHVMLGGVAKHYTDKTINGQRDFDYVPIRTLTSWIDLDLRASDRWSPGIFFGYGSNQGTAKKATVVTSMSRGADIGELMHISPRLYYHASAKMWMGVEYTANNARYGTLDDYAKPKDLKGYTNHRFAFHMRYMF